MFTKIDFKSESELITTISNYYELICGSFYDDEAKDFFRQQVKILRTKLDKIQSQNEEDEESEEGICIYTQTENSYYDTQEDTRTDIESTIILSDNFDDSYKRDVYYSLRSWIEYEMNVTREIATKLAIKYCTDIKEYYVNEYNIEPVKICKEKIPVNDTEYKDILVNSYNRIEFETVIKPYLEETYTAESST